jgi:hypothetical protein
MNEWQILLGLAKEFLPLFERDVFYIWIVDDSRGNPDIDSEMNWVFVDE